MYIRCRPYNNVLVCFYNKSHNQNRTIFQTIFDLVYKLIYTLFVYRKQNGNKEGALKHYYVTNNTEAIK